MQWEDQKSSRTGLVGLLCSTPGAVVAGLPRDQPEDGRTGSKSLDLELKQSSTVGLTGGVGPKLTASYKEKQTGRDG
ncbi:hypothetical protein BY996DRAFT_6480408 [Phakopsora pachyrhizi]|nr:hypothetical protein BY996DRAFT_6480408 [Phakopsora pachyrhizi]